jgi:ABC-type lipoprotein export system ATPase subunit
MTPRTERKVVKIIKEMKQERDQTFIMVMEISVL